MPFATAAFFTIALVTGCAQISKLREDNSALLNMKDQLLAFKEDSAKKDPFDFGSDQKYPTVKGKAVILIKEEGGAIEFDRFNNEGKFVDLPETSSGRFLPAQIYARKPDEIETLIRIECTSSSGSADYKRDGSYDTERVGYTNKLCDVLVFDYRDKKLTGSYKAGSDAAPEVIYGNSANQDNGRTIGEAARYVQSLPLGLVPRTMATPSGPTISVSEISKNSEKSTDSMKEYQGKEITLNGFGTISGTGLATKIYLKATKDESATAMVTCEFEPSAAPDFVVLSTERMYSLTVVGTFQGEISLTLKKCRLVKSEDVGKRF